MSYQAIKDTLRAAEQSVAAKDLAQAHKHVLEAVEQGASAQDIGVNLSPSAKRALQRYARRSNG